MRWLRLSVVPSLACLAAFFAVLPQTGADATVRLVRAPGGVAFRPAVLHVDVGARIAFVNETKRTHTASCGRCPAGGAFDTTDIQPGQTRFLTFQTEGTHEYQDAYEARLTGVIVVGAATAEPSPSASPSESAAPSPAASPSASG